MTEFEPGDRALKHGEEVEIVLGPINFPSIVGGYVIKKSDGDHEVSPRLTLAPMKPTDPRREVVAKWLFQDDDSPGLWTEVGQGCRQAYLESADSLLAALDGHAQQDSARPIHGTGLNGQGLGNHFGPSSLYAAVAADYARWRAGADDAPARYRDVDGDVWEQQPDGTLTCITENGGPASRARRSWAHGYSVSEADSQFGPLTRI